MIQVNKITFCYSDFFWIKGVIYIKKKYISTIINGWTRFSLQIGYISSNHFDEYSSFTVNGNNIKLITALKFSIHVERSQQYDKCALLVPEENNPIDYKICLLTLSFTCILKYYTIQQSF